MVSVSALYPTYPTFITLIVKYIQGTHSNCIFKFPVFSLSDDKFSLCEFTRFVTVTYTQLTHQAFKKKRFSGQILKYLLPLESGNLQLEQTKFPVSLCFGKLFKLCVFPDRKFFLAIFPVFLLVSIVQWVPCI